MKRRNFVSCKALRLFMMGAILLFLVLASVIFPRTDIKLQAAKIRTGFYVGAADNSRRLAVQEVQGNQVQFVLFYTAMNEALSDPIIGKIKNGKVRFSFKSDWGNSGSGTLVFRNKYVLLKTEGNDLISTDGKIVKLKYINDDTNVTQIY